MLRQNAQGWRNLVLVLALGAILPWSVILARGGGQEDEAPLMESDRVAGKVIPDHYIVVFKKGANEQELRAAQTLMANQPGVSIHKTYNTALRGYAAMLSNEALAAVRRDRNVEYVERDQVVTLSVTQNNATWGLDRTDQRNLPLSTTYTYDTTASGVTAYIIDTGIRTTHVEFGGRAVIGADTVGDGQAGNDCNGHGTHVAGTVGGTTYGIAKGVSLIAVRVLDCNGSGTTSGVIAGVDWVTADHAAGELAVANMSLGGGVSTTLDTAVANSINDGVVYAVAAGNSNANACNSSPARAPAALTVGSTTSTDARSSFSNFGTCLDLFAPGSSITSAWNTSNTATNTISGTSMASPHTAGVAALYMALNPSATASAVANAVVSNATTGVVTGAGTGSPNRLLHSLFGGGPPPTPPPTPVPTPTPPPGGCSAPYTETFTGTLSGTGAVQYHPNPYYLHGPTGHHLGRLVGPAGTDFDLRLQRWSSFFGWQTVASSLSVTSVETIDYNSTTANRYWRWRINSYSGSGPYTFCMDRP